MRLSILLVIFLVFCGLAKAQDRYLDAIDDTSIRFDTSYWVNQQNILAFENLHAWKEWKMVENFTFQRNRGDLPMIVDLESLHPFFRDKIKQLIYNCSKKGIELAIVESFRTKAKQAEYFGMGKKYTRTVGGKSKHQYGLACDVVPIVNDTASWEDKLLWKKIGLEGEAVGLRWGGRWRTPFDPAHFEWTGGFTTEQLVAGEFPKPTTKEYPCIDEDIAALRKFWEAWENKQALAIGIKKSNELVSSKKP